MIFGIKTHVRFVNGEGETEEAVSPIIGPSEDDGGFYFCLLDGREYLCEDKALAEEAKGAFEKIRGTDQVLDLTGYPFRKADGHLKKEQGLEYMGLEDGCVHMRTKGLLYGSQGDSVSYKDADGNEKESILLDWHIGTHVYIKTKEGWIRSVEPSGKVSFNYSSDAGYRFGEGTFVSIQHMITAVKAAGAAVLALAIGCLLWTL